MGSVGKKKPTQGWPRARLGYLPMTPPFLTAFISHQLLLAYVQRFGPAAQLLRS
jgi:hypothetical protein